MKIELQEGSALMAQSWAGIAATVIQSTAASRPMRAAKSWLTKVENVLLTNRVQLLRTSSILAST
jgi:hypothetical protein